MNTVNSAIETIILVDPFSTGHHIEYARLAIKSARNAGLRIILVCNEEMRNALRKDVDHLIVIEYKNKKNFLLRELSRVNYLRAVNRFIKSENPNICHFLYMDWFVRAAIYLSKHKSTRYFGTIHWLPMISNEEINLIAKITIEIDKAVIRRLTIKGWRFVCHSTKGAQAVFGNSVYVLNYPIHNMRDVTDSEILMLRQSINLSKDNILLLCFGGTRYDKGADIAAKALAGLPDKYHLLIAGRDEGLSFKQLRSIELKGNCTDRLHLKEGYVSEQDMAIYFNASDIILLPYRKNFSGQSGPLIIGASLGKPILSTDTFALKDIVNEYKLGLTFKAEDEISLIDTCKRLVSYTESRKSELFLKNHAPENFINNLARYYRLE